LPASLKKIGGSAFAKCSMLGELRCNASQPPKIEKSTFKDVIKQNVIRLSVPRGTANKYRADKYWSLFGSFNENRLTGHDRGTKGK
jgi:hypothetical protein